MLPGLCGALRCVWQKRGCARPRLRGARRAALSLLLWLAIQSPGHAAEHTATTAPVALSQASGVQHWQQKLQLCAVRSDTHSCHKRRWHAQRHPDLQIRGLIVALLTDLTPHAQAAHLAVLATDPAVAVRNAALLWTQRLCAAEKLGTHACMAYLELFKNDTELSISFSALDTLARLPTGLENRLGDVPRQYKLDTLADVAVRMRRQFQPQWLRTLLFLSGDPDDQVRQEALWLLQSYESPF